MSDAWAMEVTAYGSVFHHDCFIYDLFNTELTQVLCE